MSEEINYEVPPYYTKQSEVVAKILKYLEEQCAFELIEEYENSVISFRERFAVSRKEWICEKCKCVIKIGTRYLNRTMVTELSFRENQKIVLCFCPDCAAQVTKPSTKKFKHVFKPK